MDFHNKRFVGAIQAEINPLRHKDLCLSVENFPGKEMKVITPLARYSCSDPIDP